METFSPRLQQKSNLQTYRNYLKGRISSKVKTEENVSQKVDFLNCYFCLIYLFIYISIVDHIARCHHTRSHLHCRSSSVPLLATFRCKQSTFPTALLTHAVNYPCHVVAAPTVVTTLKDGVHMIYIPFFSHVNKTRQPPKKGTSSRMSTHCPTRFKTFWASFKVVTCLDLLFDDND